MRDRRRVRFFCQLDCNSFRIRLLGFLLAISIVPPAEGAVRRRLNVRSNPPGALVYVDNQQIGATPCSVDFVYYGTREIRLIKPGFETLTVNQPVPTPWYEFPGLDFISENLVPTKIRDNRTVTYNLAPQVIVPTAELLDRANQLRHDTLQRPGAPSPINLPAGSVVVPAPPAPAIAAPPPSNVEPLPGIPAPPFNQPSLPPAGTTSPGGAPPVAPAAITSESAGE